MIAHLQIALRDDDDDHDYYKIVLMHMQVSRYFITVVFLTVSSLMPIYLFIVMALHIINSKHRVFGFLFYNRHFKK